MGLPTTAWSLPFTPIPAKPDPPNPLNLAEASLSRALRGGLFLPTILKEDVPVLSLLLDFSCNDMIGLLRSDRLGLQSEVLHFVFYADLSGRLWYGSARNLLEIIVADIVVPVIVVAALSQA